MRFIRHLIAVLLVVAVIVAASVLWAHVSGAGTAGAMQPPHAVLVRIGQIKAGRIPVRSNDGINFSQYQNLVRSGLIETALAAVVVTIGIIRRQQRRARAVRRRPT